MNKMEMNKLTENQEKWLQALESGKYKQGRKFLAGDDPETGECSFCCLGVWCELSGLPHGPDELNEGRVERLYTFKSGKTNTHINLDYKELNLFAENGSFRVIENTIGLPYYDRFYRFSTIPTVGTSLAALNDSGKYNFKQIAALIREEPWVVFSNFETPHE